MGLFKKSPPPPSGPRVFDGVAGRQQLAGLAEAFLERAVSGYIEPVGQVSQQIMSATPGDGGAPVGQDFFTAPWAWMTAVAERAESDGDWLLPARLGLVAEIWRMILTDEPRFQMGRLVSAPAELETRLYASALRSLVRLRPDAAVARFTADGWTASEAVDQIVGTVQKLAANGNPVGIALADFVAGVRFAPDPAALAPRSEDADLIDRMAVAVNANVADAQAGDAAAAAWLQAGGIVMNGGDDREALVLLERAAQGGHLKAMFDAGCTASRLGEHQKARYWFEVGTDAGSADCAWNLAVTYFNGGRLEEASRFYLRTAELGDARGYAALTQMADNAGDEPAELRWARLGAEAGQEFCMHRHAMSIAMSGGDASTTRRARDLFEAAADKGWGESMSMAVATNIQLGERARAQRFIDMVVQSGDADEIDRLRRYGYL